MVPNTGAHHLASWQISKSPSSAEMSETPVVMAVTLALVEGARTVSVYLELRR